MNDEYAVAAAQAIPYEEIEGCIKSRRIDFVHQRAEYLAALFPAMLQRAIEVKVVGDNLKKFETCQNDGKEQLLGHQSKRLQFSFDFAGVGQDDKVLGVVLSVASVVVYELKLEGVGTENVSLTRRATDCLPLMGIKFVPEYLMADTGIVCRDEIPDHTGFVVLAGALMDLVSTGETVCKRLFSVKTIKTNLCSILAQGRSAMRSKQVKTNS